MDNYMDEFLNELQKYILKIVDVHMNGNCGLVSYEKWMIIPDVCFFPLRKASWHHVFAT